MNEDFKKYALSDFSGCDFNDKEISKNSIWLMGVEHGSPKWRPENRDEGDDLYSLEEQLGYAFNRKSFKLFAAMHGYGTDWRGFASKYKPFVKGDPGFFKGNLYPYPCKNLHEWSDSAKLYTGFDSKADYLAWCHEYRFPVIQGWVKKYCPRLIIASGLSSKGEFVKLMMDGAELKKMDFVVPDDERRHFFYANSENLLLVVTPHLSGARLWSSDVSLQAAGNAIANLYEMLFAKKLSAT